MRTILATLGISGILVWFCSAQEPATPVASNATGSDNVTPGIPKSPLAAATLSRRVIEFNAQFELLNQLAQEHRKRAEETPRDQDRYQWESQLAKELGDRAATIRGLLNNTNKESLAAAALSNSVSEATNGRSPEGVAFLAALAERRTAVQQEIAAGSEAANLYAIQLATNNNNSDLSNIYRLIRDNASSVKQLQKELFDLDLKNLEFRALRKQ